MGHPMRRRGAAWGGMRVDLGPAQLVRGFGRQASLLLKKERIHAIENGARAHSTRTSRYESRSELRPSSCFGAATQTIHAFRTCGPTLNRLSRRCMKAGGQSAHRAQPLQSRPDGPSRMGKRPTGSGGEPSSPNRGASAGIKARHPFFSLPSLPLRRRA